MLIFQTSVLNPALKLSYAKEHRWEEHIVDKLEQQVKNSWRTFYKPQLDLHLSSHRAAISSGIDADGSEELQTHTFKHLKRQHLEEKDELEVYLSMPTVEMSADAFWRQYVLKPNSTERSSQFPNLSLMAKDYLSIPATSASVERLFSAAKLVITDKRGGLL
ncbi:Phospholipase C [Gonapodya sp. JEL0774]|nr:Phospholipase C [Gonapodya sp. JEL0774]